jgi:hypothetical protein
MDPREAVGVEALGLDDCEGDVAIELCVVREVDALAATLAEVSFHLVAPPAE